MRATASLLLVALAGGCSAPLIRVAAPEPGGSPVIEEAVDLGGLPLPELGLVPDDASDDRFTPGEHVALVGRGLHEASVVTVGGVSAPVVGYLQGGSLLVRVPLGVDPGNQDVVVETPAGSARGRVPCSIYAFGADVQEGALHFRRLGPESSEFEEDELTLELEKARFLALSADGGFLYAIQKPVLDTSFVPDQVNTAIKIARTIQGGPVDCTLLAIHLGAADGPEISRSLRVTLEGKPTGMAAGAGGQLVVLQKRHFTVFDLSDPTSPAQAKRIEIAGEDETRELIEAQFLADGTTLAVLEAYHNEVHWYDVRDPRAPRRLGSAILSKDIGEPFSIDMVLADDRQSVWVLQGPNLRLAGKRLLDGVKALWQDVKQLEFGAAIDTVGHTAGRVQMKSSEGLNRLVRVGLHQGEPAILSSVALPKDLFPFFCQPDGHGNVYVSAIDKSVFDLIKLELSLDGLLSLLDLLQGLTRIGVVTKTNMATGKTDYALQSLAIYYDLGIAPRGELLASVVRLGPGYLPPRITLDWGIEIPRASFAKFREIANSTTALTDALKKLLPPYDYERIGIQR